MLLDLRYAVVAQTTPWFSLYHLNITIWNLVNEVSTLWRVLIRNFWNFSLSRHNLIPYFLTVLPDVRSPAHNEFISDDSYGKIVGTEAVILSAHYFWSHVAWSA